MDLHCRDSITIWMKRNIGVYVPTITTKNEAYDVLSVEYKLVIGFLDKVEALSRF